MLELKGVEKRFWRDGDAPVTALDNINVRFDEGQFCIIVGNNGCGKSTLLNVIDGDVEPDRGQILWQGKELKALLPSERQRVAAKVHQNPSDGTAQTLTIAENLALAMLPPGRAGLRKLVRGERIAHIASTLNDLDIGLGKREGATIKNLSGGQRQALALCMAVLTEPKILLLDEHTAALDPERAQSLMELTVRFWKDKGLTVLMVTHNLEEAIKYGERLLCMSQGRIYADIDREAKKRMTISDLLDLFKRKREEGFVVDSSLS
jgi:putative tryptophan/tyrosine transport system ATP-binding protein